VEGLKETIRRLKQGAMVLVFPEGTRSLTGELGEFRPGLVSLAARTKASIIRGDIETHQGTRIKSDSVHLAILANVLFQCDNKLGAIREALRTLTPQGKLAVIDWSDSFNGLGPIPAHVVTKEQAAALCETAGATLVREFPAGEHHYGLLYARPN
jgi:hypothetical protein